MKVFVSRALPGPALDSLAQQVDLHIWPERSAPTASQLQDNTADCEGLLCTLTESVDAQLLQAAPQLRVVSSCSVGVDHVDVEALNQRQISLGYTPHVLVDATADLAFALLLSAARRLPEASQFMQQGQWTPARRWEPDLLLGKDLRGATLGLIGLGAIGQAVARRAQAFGMNILGWTPSGREVAGVENTSLDTLLQRADFVSLHLALSTSSQHVINRKTLALMKPDALLINTARGGLVDENALLGALQNNRLGGAALDVFEQEPVPCSHPLLALPNVVHTPHIGSATLGTRTAMAQLAVDNLLAGLAGQAMPHCYNPQVQQI